MKKLTIAKVFAALFLVSGKMSAQLPNIEMEKGMFEPNWSSLSQWECPEWYQDAKFGLWAHWGPQCQANSGDWYARYMYDGQTHWDEEMQAYINCKEYGFKEYCRDWKADKWDPEAILAKYEKVGAKFFMALANHHDNFDCWDSPYQEWNCVNIGPKKDLCAGWAEAARNHGMKFGLSVHASHAWTWYEIGRKYGDVRLTKEDGIGKWWEGYDPNELYAQAHETVSSGWDNIGNIHNQWNWNNGASIPDAAYKTKLQNRCRQMVNALQPDLVYFDDTVLPFWGCDNQWGQDFLAYYYNHMSNLNGGGVPQVVCCGKVLPEEQKESMLWDVERGIPDRPRKKPWQTDTCIGGWHYAYHDRGNYKSAETVIRMLIDIVSKNGNLALSIPLKGEGTYDEQEAAVLDGIQAWMEINGESIYGTRVWWDCFGEGPLAEATNELNGQGFNEGQNYSNQDVRYVTKGDTIYGTIMAWPDAGEFTMKAFGLAAESYHGQVDKVYLLGYGEVPFRQTIEGLIIDIPNSKPNPIAPAFRITFSDETLTGYDMLQKLINEADEIHSKALPTQDYINTGKCNPMRLAELAEAIAKAKEITADAEDQAITNGKNALIEAYQKYRKEAVNPGGLWQGKDYEDVTTDKFIQSSGFTRSAGGTYRFGKPKNWTVENFKIPNGGDGTKNGLDKYSGQDALMLGVWNDAGSNQEGDLSNARIYRKVKLEKGIYYFGAAYNAAYQLSPQAYMFVSKELCDTKDIPEKSMAHYGINQIPNDMSTQGLWVNIPEDMEVYIGFQVNLNMGSSTQEFRAERVYLYKQNAVSSTALEELTTTIKTELGTLEARLSDINTGYLNPTKFNAFVAKVDNIVARLNEMTDSEIETTYYELSESWERYQSEGLNEGGVLDGVGYTDITEEILIERDNFSRKDSKVTTRFATPLYWNVQNFKIPNGSDGTKNGLDNYSGTDALMLGVWNDRSKNTDGILGSARIYKKVHLEAGTYFFGATFNALYEMHCAYMCAIGTNVGTNMIPKKSVAYLSLNDCKADGEVYGINFRLDEERDINLCFQANLANGSETQEFRANSVTLLRYDAPTGIEDVQQMGTSTSMNTNTRIYTLDGKQHNAMQRGINIVGGQKILRK